jgi:DNA-directed RNA polymerase subunit beta'
MLDWRTLKPVPGGLFCERIFGPVQDWHCACRLYRSADFMGRVCPTCGVEVTRSAVRRERNGYLELAAPVCHPEYVHAAAQPLAKWCGLEQPELEALVYHTHYRVLTLDAGELRQKCEEWRRALRSSELDAATLSVLGAALERLEALRVDDMLAREEMEPFHLLHTTLATQAPGELERHVEIRTGAAAVRTLLRWAGNPDRGRVVLECLPVIPAGLRDFYCLDDRRIAWREVNDLYRRVIHRSLRLRKLAEISAPAAILDGEQQRLQELVDALIDNARAPKQVLNDRGKPLECLADLVEEGVLEDGT